MSLYAAVAGAAIAVAVLWGVWEKGKDAGEAQCQAVANAVRDGAAQASASAASAAASAIANMKVRNVTIRQETEREIRTNTVYGDCRNTPDVMRNINEALTGGAEPVGGGLVPRSDAAGR